jgi:phosphate transport system substrate-binding protein
MADDSISAPRSRPRPTFWRRAFPPALLAVCSLPASAQPDEPAAGLPAYHAASSVGGVLTAGGSEMMAGLMKRWATAFAAIHPGADIAFAVRPGAIPADRVALGADTDEVFHNDPGRYIEKYRRDPFRVEASLGSFDTKGKIQALGVMVHRSNPLSRLTLAELDAIYSSTRRRGHPRDIITWGDLGLTGEWAGRPIHLYGRLLDQDVPWLFRDAIMLGGFFKRAYRSPGKGGSVDVVDAVAADPQGITFVAFMHATPGVKPLALVDRDGTVAEPTAAGLASGHYPLARPIWLYVNRGADAALDPLTKEFLAFVLSREGQAIVAADNYLPLPVAQLLAERAKLE